MDRNNDIVPDLLERWHDTKQQIKKLEAECDKYKRAATKIMDKQGRSTLSSDYYNLRRTDVVRATLSKSSVPSDIWSKYSTQSTHQTYYLTEKT